MLRQCRDWCGSIEITCPPFPASWRAEAIARVGDPERHADLDGGCRVQAVDRAVQRIGVGDADVAVQADRDASAVADRRRGIDVREHGIGYLEGWFEQVSKSHSSRTVSNWGRGLIDSLS